MQFKPAVVAAFVAVGLTIAAPPDADVKVGSSDTIRSAISAGKGASVVFPGGNTYVFYQATDNSIRQLTGTGPPLAMDSYREDVRSPSNTVRKNTPMAAVILDKTNVSTQSSRMLSNHDKRHSLFYDID